MKKLLLISIFSIIAIAIGSCDKVEDPIKPAILIDTNLYPGNWSDYPYPTFTANLNTQRNVLLEDYTGHRCPNCPAAASIAKGMAAADPTHIFVASIHAGPGGISSFQDTASDCSNLVTNPNGEFCTEFYCNESVAYGSAFASGYGFYANPQGTVNRIAFDGSLLNTFLLSTDWQTRADQVLSANDLKVNIQAKSNYYSATNGMYLHVETEFLESLTGNYNLVVYVLENEVIDFQDSASIILDDYEHHNVFRGCIDGLPWGRTVNGTHAQGEKTYYDYSFELPTGKLNTDYNLLIYVYDVATYEILQVVKHEF